MQLTPRIFTFHTCTHRSQINQSRYLQSAPGYPQVYDYTNWKLLLICSQICQSTLSQQEQGDWQGLGRAACSQPGGTSPLDGLGRYREMERGITQRDKSNWWLFQQWRRRRGETERGEREADRWKMGEKWQSWEQEKIGDGRESERVSETVGESALSVHRIVFHILQTIPPLSLWKECNLQICLFVSLSVCMCVY